MTLEFSIKHGMCSFKKISQPTIFNYEVKLIWRISYAKIDMEDLICLIECTLAYPFEQTGPSRGQPPFLPNETIECCLKQLKDK